MTRVEIVAEVEELFSSLLDASIQKDLGEEELGGCKRFDLSNFPKEYHKHILKYLEHGTNSVEVALDYYDELRVNA